MHNICLITRTRARGEPTKITVSDPNVATTSRQRPRTTLARSPVKRGTGATRCTGKVRPWPRRLLRRTENVFRLSRTVQTLNRDTQFVLISGSTVGVGTGGDRRRTQRHKLILLSQASAGVFAVDNHRESYVNSSFSRLGAILQKTVRVLSVSP